MLNKFAESVGFQIHLGLIENAGKTVITVTAGQLQVKTTNCLSTAWLNGGPTP